MEEESEEEPEYFSCNFCTKIFLTSKRKEIHLKLEHPNINQINQDTTISINENSTKDEIQINPPQHVNSDQNQNLPDQIQNPVELLKVPLLVNKQPTSTEKDTQNTNPNEIENENEIRVKVVKDDEQPSTSKEIQRKRIKSHSEDEDKKNKNKRESESEGAKKKIDEKMIINEDEDVLVIKKNGKKIFQCPYCSNCKFGQKGHYTHHVNIHKGIKFTCSACKKSFRTEYLLSHHKKYKLCPNYNYKSKKGEIENVNKKICKFSSCNYSSNFPGNLNRHYRTVHKIDKVTFKSKIIKNKLRKKQNSVDEDENNDKDKRSSVNPRRGKCSICNKELARKNIKDHISRHKNIKNYFCQICNGSFYYKDSLRRHYKDVHKCPPPQKKLENKEIIRKEKENKPQKIIKKTLKLKSDSEGQNEKFKSISRISYSSKIERIGKSRYKCTICKKEMSFQGITDHMSKHQNVKNWFCEHCSFSSFYYSNLYRHYKEVHQIWKSKKDALEYNQKKKKIQEKVKIPIKSVTKKLNCDKKKRRCSICHTMIPGQIFQKHAQKHKNVVSYPCEKCTFSTFHYSCLWRHYKVVHNITKSRSEILKNKKPFNQNKRKCDKSPKKKKDQKLLKSPLKKEYPCLICKEVFTAFDSLKIHLKIHLNEPSPKKPKKTPKIDLNTFSKLLNCLVNCDKCKEIMQEHGKYLEKAEEKKEREEQEADLESSSASESEKDEDDSDNSDNQSSSSDSDQEDNSSKSESESETDKSDGSKTNEGNDNSSKFDKNDGSNSNKDDDNSSGSNSSNDEDSSSKSDSESDEEEDYESYDKDKKEPFPRRSERIVIKRESDDVLNYKEIEPEIDRFCGFCSKTFSSEKSLICHKILFHKKDWLFNCSYCDQKARTVEKLKVHVFRAHPEHYA